MIHHLFCYFMTELKGHIPVLEQLIRHARAREIEVGGIAEK